MVLNVLKALPLPAAAKQSLGARQLAGLAGPANKPASQPIPPAPRGGADSQTNGFRTLLAWLFVLILVYIFDKTRIGHVLMYYALAAIIFTTLLISAQEVAWVLAPLSNAWGAELQFQPGAKPPDSGPNAPKNTQTAGADISRQVAADAIAPVFDTLGNFPSF